MKENIDHLELENDLIGILNPIAPSNDFIDELHQRLKSKAEVIVEYPNYLLPMIIIFSGLFLGVGIIWLLGKLYRLVAGNMDD